MRSECACTLRRAIEGSLLTSPIATAQAWFGYSDAMEEVCKLPAPSVSCRREVRFWAVS